MSQDMNDAFLFDAIRTPRGKGRAGGGLSEVRPVELVARLLDAMRGRHEGVVEEADDFLLGCVTQSGEQGANLAKIAALYAGLPDQIAGATINRFCTSGLDAVGFAAARIRAGMGDVMLAGGVESMSRVPIFSDRGAWFSDPEVARKAKFVQMGFAADLVATLEGFERSALDAIAARSHQRAAIAQQEGYFSRSIVPITHGSSTFSEDELVRASTTAEGISGFDPLFADAASEELARERYPELGAMRHLHHRANSPSLADGASLTLLATREAGERFGAAPRARVVSFATSSVEPLVMLTAAQGAAEKALDRAGMAMEDLDLIELNEAFAAVVCKFLTDFDLDPAKVNVNGGTIAAGHAMGATGAILLGVLVDELERRDLERGLVAVSGGAGLGSAMIIERV